MAFNDTPTSLVQPFGQAELSTVTGVVHQFCTYYSLLLIVTGCVCNPLAFVVFSRKTYRHSTIGFYLRILSISDLGAIINGVLVYVLLHTFGIELRNSRIKCQVYFVLAQLFIFCSHWTLVIVGIERAISITRPHAVRSLCTPYVAKLSLGLLFVAAFAFAVPYALIWGPVLAIDEQTNETIVVASCTVMFVSEEIILAATIVDTTLFAFLPCLLILVLNVIIINGVIKSKKRILKAGGKLEIGISDRQDGQFDRLGTSASTDTNTRTMVNSNLEDNRKKKETSLTRTLLCVNTAFAICVFPAYAWFLGPHIQSPDGLGEIGNAVTEILTVFLYTNNALNFFFYCTTGSKFRAELRVVFKDLYYTVVPQRR